MHGNYRYELTQLQLKNVLTECSEIKQRLRRRQQERQKSNRFTLAKQQLCTCITFLYISLPSLNDYNVKIPDFLFCERT